MTNKTWVPSAPERLIRACESGNIHLGKDLLIHLLRDPDMSAAWAVLAKRVKDDNQWMYVWRCIKLAKHRSNAAKWRTRASDERDRYLAVAEDIAAVAKAIERRFPLLDVLVSELLPQDVLAALHVKDPDGAHSLLPAWPSATEVLRQLEQRARTQAHDAMTVSRIDERDRGQLVTRIFVWHLGQEFRGMFGTPLYETLAKITNSMFYSNPPCIDKIYVQGVLRGRRKAG